MKLFIGCSSKNTIPETYFSDCQKYLEELLMDNDVVFGTSSDGLMGLSHDIAKKNGKKVIGIYVKEHSDELSKLECDQVEFASSVSDRTNKIFENSDAIIFLPGGIGTIFELISAIEFKRNNELNKPIILYNSNNFFDGLLQFLELIYKQNFADEEIKDCYYISDSASDTLNYLKNNG